MAGPDPVTVSEALSGIMGSISLVSWIVLLLPQLIENYKNGRADALSLGFITAWFLGDIANLIGAIWGGLLPTVIAIAVYFCFSDAILVGQTIYYNHLARPRPRCRRSSNADSDDPTQPLIGERQRRASVLSQARARRRDSLSSAALPPSPPPPRCGAAVANVLALLGVCAAGTAGWLAAYLSGAWTGSGADSSPDAEMPLGAQVLGYASAVLYLTARIPQIVHNHRKRSCEGLSFLFFCLSLLGNITYGAGILFHSTEPAYVVRNLPWLLGSLGTMIEDIAIFAQFYVYRRSSLEPVFERD